MNIAHPPFKLFPEDRHFWSLNDYGAVLGVMQELQPKRVLEFGPGSSTLALIEGGAEHIDCCEDKLDWAAIYRDRLQKFYPGKVFIHMYDWSDPVSILGIDEQTYDMALIDGPFQTGREAAIEYALQRCAAVLFPTEDYSHPSALRPLAWKLAEKYGKTVDITDTGPLSGGFALLR